MNELSGLFVPYRSYFWDSRNNTFASGHQQLDPDDRALVCTNVALMGRYGSASRSLCLGASTGSTDAGMKQPLLHCRLLNRMSD